MEIVNAFNAAIKQEQRRAERSSRGSRAHELTLKRVCGDFSVSESEEVHYRKRPFYAFILWDVAVALTSDGVGCASPDD